MLRLRSWSDMVGSQNRRPLRRPEFPLGACREPASTAVLERRRNTMLYAMLCYHSEDVVSSWTKEEDDAVMARLAVVQEGLMKNGKLGPVARLLPTTAATTLRKDREPALVLDGPYAETKEQLLGFYILDCESLDEALGIARELGRANPGGAYEIRPVGHFSSGGLTA
jgi:hypothetical protein